MIVKLRSRIVDIEAIRWTGDNYDEIRDWSWNGKDVEVAKIDDQNGTLTVYNTQEMSWIPCPMDHWVFKGQLGEFYPVSNEAMIRKYDVIEEGPS